MWETFGHVHAASAEVGRTTAALLAGDDRGHVPEQLEEADDAMRELIRARCCCLTHSLVILRAADWLDCRAPHPASAG